MNFYKYLLIIAVIFVSLFAASNALVGGFSEPHKPDHEHLQVWNNVQGQFLQRANMAQSNAHITVESVSTQIVSGVNYLFRVNVGGHGKYDVKVYQNLARELSLTSVNKV